jgi:hypothetical protein
MCTSKPKIPAPTPVIERQAYRSPAPREGVSSGDPSRRRRIAGMATSPQGLTSEASTTRRVRMGGDDPLNPTLGGSSSAPNPGSIIVPPVEPVTPVRGAQTPRATGSVWQGAGTPAIEAMARLRRAAY